MSEEVSQWVTFTLENETYGINVMQIQEVLRYTEIAPVPGSAHYILGIINLRGNVVTVVDGRQKLSLPDVEEVSSSRIIIIEVYNQVLGLLADSVSEVIEIPQDKIEVTQQSSDDHNGSNYIFGVSQINEKLLILMDVEKLFVAELDNENDDGGVMDMGF
jgi:purine-binding chemotaxis protein CheW